MLGDIVHNEDVVKKLSQAGINKIKKLGKGKGKTLLIRAHGATTKHFQLARRLGYNIIDITCPMVKEIHKIAKQAQGKGYQIIVIGDKKHQEVQGIVGQLKQKAAVIDRLENIPATIQRLKKAAVVVQSTQDINKVLKIVKHLECYIKELKFFNTICKPTRAKQEEIKTIARTNQVIIIIGSRISANTRRLYEISKSLNKRTYWVQSKNELKRGWFKGVKTVGITTGASTPEATTQSVIAQIKSYC